MRKERIKQNIIASGIVFFSSTVVAWSVPETVVEFSSELTPKAAPVHLEKKTIPMNEPKALSETGLSQSALDKARQRFQDKQQDFVFQKTLTKLSPMEQAAIDYQRAVQYLRTGNEIQSEQILIEVLVRTPDYHLARSELATLYLKQDELDEAERLLVDGLKLEANDADFLRLMAVIHDRKNEPDKALALLVRVPNDRKKDKHYVAFLGHVYQKMGQYSLARQQYFRLLQVEPKNPVWLLGLSIALDSEGHRDAALEGYRRLVSEGNVEISVLEYARERIKHLKG